MKRVLIVGTGFAGYTAALELSKLFAGRHEITVLAPSPKFVYYPSLIWVPFGVKDPDEISFDVRPIYGEHGIRYAEAAAVEFDPEKRQVRTEGLPLEYDYLVIATGPKIDSDRIPGLRNGRTSWSILNLPDAVAARSAWESFLKDPGPVVIGTTQGASLFSPAYEFLLNARFQLAKHGLLGETPLTFVTAEPFLMHLGVGGIGRSEELCERRFVDEAIDWYANAEVREVHPDRVVLRSGREIPSKYTMLIPPFSGVDAVKRSSGLSDRNGFLEVDDHYRHHAYPEIYAAGVAVRVRPRVPSDVTCYVPRMGSTSVSMARTAAWNIYAELAGKRPKQLPIRQTNARHVLDAGNGGMVLLGDPLLEPRRRSVATSGRHAHWAKLAFEKYFLYSRQRGNV